MKINNIDNAMNFNAIYKVRANSSNIKYFDEVVAPIYRSKQKGNIRGFIKNISEFYTLTGKDAYEFDKKYQDVIREKANLKFVKYDQKNQMDNVIGLPQSDNNFIKDFLENKNIEIFDNFKNFIDKIFG